MKIVLIWIIVAPIILTLFGKGTLDQLFVGIGPGVILLSAFFLSKMKKGNILLLMLVFFNLWQVWKNFPTNTHVFFQAPQPAVRYSDQLSVVDEIYKRIGNESFEIQAYTIPYAWQDGWRYLFWYNGVTRYGGKIPVEHGGYRMFVIIQKDRSNHTFQENWYRDSVSTLGKLTDTFIIGEYTVEERVMYNESP